MFGRSFFAKGFTLVEVMVVIVVMLVLASMLFVGFSRAQKRAVTTQCMNNLRQIGTLIINYANQKGGGYLPDFGITGGRGMSDLWILELDFLNVEDRYAAVDHVEKVVPPRMAPAVLRCPADVLPYVNYQSVLISYWMHPENAHRPLASITNQDETLLGMEGDPLYTLSVCGCRFAAMQPPIELDVTHFRGGHVLFVNGTVRLISDPESRKRVTLERKAGWDPKKLREKYNWPWTP